MQLLGDASQSVPLLPGDFATFIRKCGVTYALHKDNKFSGLFYTMRGVQKVPPFKVVYWIVASILIIDDGVRIQIVHGDYTVVIIKS